MVAEVGLEPTSLAYETKLEPPPVYSAINRLRVDSRSALPFGRLDLHLGCGQGSPAAARDLVTDL